MFKRFTERARRVIILAREEAELYRHEYLGTEHILQGVIKDGGGIAVAIIHKTGTDITQLKKVFVNAPYEKNSNIVPRGIAYVNNFLKLKRSEWKKDLYDISLNLLLSDEEIRTAQKELEGTSLHNLYASSTEELYIENYEKTKTIRWFEV